MRIVADENIPLAEAFFADLGTLHRVAGRSMTPEQVRAADVLLVRSVTRVDEQLLAGSKVRFVGTATIGTDHIDQQYLQRQGIAFHSAPGCNADSVADYVLAALLTLAERDQQKLVDKTVGIVGVGNVGSRLLGRLQALGVRCLQNDPPRAAREGASSSGDFVSLDEIIATADILCLHTPLTGSGDWPTHHLLDRERIAQLRPGTWLLNAGRGAVVCNQALKQRLQQRGDLRVVLDVWEPEPQVDPELAALVDIATPHIAGYSLEGKMRGTEMLYRALCEFTGLDVQKRLSQIMPAPELSAVALDACAEGQALLRRLIMLCYDLEADDRRFRASLSGDGGERAEAFDRLRKAYPERREFSSLRISGGSDGLRDQLRACGFVV